MNLKSRLQQQLHVRQLFTVQFLSVLVAAHALFILANTLLLQIAVHRGSHLTSLAIDLPLLIGLSLLYLSTLLRRRKRTAWLVCIGAYALYFLLNLVAMLARFEDRQLSLHDAGRSLLLPLIIVGLLLRFRHEFIVRSDIRGFRSAARTSLIILSVALVYGVAGLLLLDTSDFHQEIGLPTAVHYTIDQLDLTTDRPLQPHTKRAQLFDDSLSFVSVAAVGYSVFSLFQPLRLRLTDQTAQRQRLQDLLIAYGAPSEDFFKLWPHDKQYFFDTTGRAGVAFHVSRGVALCLADPAGDPARFDSLLADFAQLCYGNDWLPAMIHTQDTYTPLYERHGFVLQKLGQEAVLDLQHFTTKVSRNKYFRQINNRFSKQDYTAELLLAPHHEAVVGRLKSISTEWLARGAHAERGFVMGYFTPAYLQQCAVMVARDAAGTIQAFVNLVPASFDAEEATFDMLRHANDTPGNLNDFLMLRFIAALHQQGYHRLNLGLCPLAGLDSKSQEANKVVDGALRFAFANGDRFYSFSGLYRFKSKYEPVWRDRYVAYQGGVRGFSRTMTALMRTMRVRVKS